MRRFLAFLMATVLLFSLILAFSACSDTSARGTVWHSGMGAPSADISANVGDLYLSDDGKVYEMTADGWVYFTDLSGADGENGKDGENGQDGQNGMNGSNGQTPTVTVSADGYWVVNGVKTSAKATPTEVEHVETVYGTDAAGEYIEFTFILTGGGTQSTKVHLPQRATALSLIGDNVFLTGDTARPRLSVTLENGITKQIVVAEEMYIIDPVAGLSAPNFDRAGIYAVQIAYLGKTVNGTVTVANATDIDLTGKTVADHKLMHNNATAADAPYNEYVDYVDISAYDAVGVICALWASGPGNHTAILLYDADKNVIAKYDYSNLGALGVALPASTSSSYNVDVKIPTNGAKYIRFCNKTATGDDDLAKGKYTLVEPALVGYSCGVPTASATKRFHMTHALSNSCQGAAVYGSYLFQAVDKQQGIAVYDLSSNTLLDTVTMTAVNTYHCNNMSFGCEKYATGDEFPLLYVSMENAAEHKAVVFRIIKSGNDFTFTKVQTVTYPANSELSMHYQNCVVDAANGLLYVEGYTENSYTQSATNKICVARFRLPALAEGDVALHAADAEEYFFVDSLTATQGAVVKNGRIVQVFGFANGGVLRVTDPATGKVLRTVSLVSLGITAEPEGLGVYGDGYILTTVTKEVWYLTI